MGPRGVGGSIAVPGSFSSQNECVDLRNWCGVGGGGEE